MVGVDPADDYRGHDIDGKDVWAHITGANTTHSYVHEFLPVTEVSLIYQGRYKYFSTTNSSYGDIGWQDQHTSAIITANATNQLRPMPLRHPR